MSERNIDRSSTLYIIGNGFDVHHGFCTRYTDFREYLMRKAPPLAQGLDSYFNCKDLWADFEHNLAYLDRETLIESADVLLKDLDSEHPDFTYADYYMGIDHVLGIIYEMTKELHYWFHKWIRCRDLPKGYKRRFLEIDSSARFINFNYTHTLETLYQIPHDHILYLHGHKDDPLGSLVLGHGGDPDFEFERWYHRNKNKPRFRPNIKNKKGRYYANDRLTYLAYFLEDEEKGNWRNEFRYYAVDQLVGEIEEYYELAQKKTHEVLRRHHQQLVDLSQAQHFVVMGHSLSPVDYPYFEQLIRLHASKDHVQWQISYYSEQDLSRINQFTNAMKIPPDQVSLFNLADLLVSKSGRHHSSLSYGDL